MTAKPIKVDAVLEAVAGVAAGLELPQTLQQIVSTATELVDAKYGALGVLGPNKEIQQFITEGMNRAVVEAIGPFPRGRGILGLLVNEPHPLRLTKLSDHPQSVGFPPGHPPMASFVGVPVRVRGEVFGNLYLTEKRTGGAFTEEDEGVLVVLAAAAGVAIENSRLYETVNRRAGWWRASSEVAASVLTGASTDVVVESVLREVRTAASAGEAEIIGVPVEKVEDPESLCVPIVVGEGERSLVVRRSMGEAPFTDDERALAESFGRQASLALALAAGRTQHERLALLEDRDRIGRDLHDLVIQRLFATGMMLQGAERLAIRPEVSERVSRAIEELDRTILEVRSTIFALREVRDGEPSGLRGQIVREIKSGSGALGFEPTVRFDGPIDSVVPAETAEHVVAALREALANAARHAGASQVRVSLSTNADEVVLIVTDNGRGLDPTVTRRSGLANLESRSDLLGGRTTLEPVVKSDRVDSHVEDVVGTRLTWRAPLVQDG